MPPAFHFCKSEKAANTLTVFAAASLGDVMRELGEKYEQEKDLKLRFNFGSSGTLARQIAEGGSPDLYISANEKWAAYLREQGIFVGEKTERIAQNRLVLIAPKNQIRDSILLDSKLKLMDYLGGQRLSLGNPTHVPAGQYARQALEHFGLYEEIESHILPGKDVRSVLRVVELEEAALGIVYRTDALRSDKVKILSLFPPEAHEGIYYYAGRCQEGQAVKDFLAFLVSDEAKGIWESYGFEI